MEEVVMAKKQTGLSSKKKASKKKVAKKKVTKKVVKKVVKQPDISRTAKFMQAKQAYKDQQQSDFAKRFPRK